MSKFPSGKHHAEAQNRLGALLAEAQQSSEAAKVTAALDAFSAAWGRMDVDAIAAAEPGLSKKKIREGLSGVRAVQMTIRQVSPPIVNGERATVLCDRTVIQTFSDGTVRQNPASRVTFHLAKRGGGWIIDSVQ